MVKFVVIDSQSLPGSDFSIEKEMFAEAGIEYEVLSITSQEEIIEKAKDADGIGLVFANINSKIISQLNDCKVIIRYGVGYDTIDIQAASKKI